MKHYVTESFMDFLQATKSHQTPNVTPTKYTLTGSYPDEADGFHLEERPEIGEGLDHSDNKLKRMESMIDSILNSSNINDPQIQEELNIAYQALSQCMANLK